jgi:methylthioribose-1-phosphate isomerase
VPSPTLDARTESGDAIPIEARGPDEVLTVSGRDPCGQTATVAIAPAGTHAVNYAFDVTPARLVTGLLTERGIVAADRASLASAFPEKFG